MIYVCIPVHDEAATIGVLLWKIRKVMADFGRDYRIVVHDDASGDGTSQVLERYRKAVPLTILTAERRLGYARSVERLLRMVAEDAPYPKRDCAVVLQGDFTEHPDAVVELVRVLEGGADIVSGTVEADALPRGVRIARWAAPYTLGAVHDRAPVTDPLTGLRAYRAIVLKKAFREESREEGLLRSEGWAANVELLGVLAPYARRISEAPVRFRNDLRVRPSRFRALRTLLGLMRLRRTGFWSGERQAA